MVVFFIYIFYIHFYHQTSENRQNHKRESTANYAVYIESTEVSFLKGQMTRRKVQCRIKLEILLTKIIIDKNHSFSWIFYSMQSLKLTRSNGGMSPTFTDSISSQLPVSL
jgi:hypothetical protein